ncbi:MAG: hypothetical protein DYG89_10165 [Caldilinea sp. CFX5]|nr:hypothetical protein [Caldilinea sp. CFX5]
MSNPNAKGIDSRQAQTFLTDTLKLDVTAVAQIGEGAWSRCFGFHQGDQELAIRFGNYVDDFQKDQLAYRYATAALPIPAVLAIGEAFGGYYAISTRVHGVPLENVDVNQWRALVPAVVGAMEAMRTADVTGTSGMGGWGLGEQAPFDRWSQHLLTVSYDGPDRRTFGWRQKLATSPEDDATFSWGYDLLQQVTPDDIPRSLLHCDLINRNVLVDDDHLAGVFDWGCSLYGDHLYELAWFEFWAPWTPNLDIPYLRTALEQRWRDVGYVPHNQAARLVACYLHIGLDHLAYNAHLEDWATLRATAEQMRALVREV